MISVTPCTELSAVHALHTRHCNSAVTDPCYVQVVVVPLTSTLGPLAVAVTG